MSVAVPIPYLDPLTYNVPSDYPALPPIGARVRVPVGTRTLVGCVVDHQAALDEGTAPRDVADVLDSEPFLPPAIVDLCGWVADYYVAGLGDAIGAAMPPGSRRTDAFKTVRMVAATPHGLSAVGVDAGADEGVGTGADAAADVRGDAGTDVGAGAAQPGFRLTPRQRDVLEMLAAAPTGLSAATLRGRGATADVVRRLAARGLVASSDERDERDPFEGAARMDVALSV